MKKHIQKILFSGVFLSTTFAFGQFNTLKPIVPKTEPKISLNLENSGKTEFNKDEKSKENLNERIINYRYFISNRKDSGIQSFVFFKNKNITLTCQKTIGNLILNVSGEQKVIYHFPENNIDKINWGKVKTEITTFLRGDKYNINKYG
jgi:hypothetical protein